MNIKRATPFFTWDTLFVTRNCAIIACPAFYLTFADFCKSCKKMEEINRCPWRAIARLRSSPQSTDKVGQREKEKQKEIRKLAGYIRKDAERARLYI